MIFYRIKLFRLPEKHGILKENIKFETKSKIGNRKIKMISDFLRSHHIHHDFVMDKRPEPKYSDIIAGRVNPIGQQNNEDRLLRINPERSPGIPQMPHAGFGKKMTATGAIG